MAKIIDRKDFYGDLLSLIDDAEAFVKKHTRLAYLFDGFNRVDIEEYPYNAIREALINAVCHRDYVSQNNCFVYVFNDSVEILSPGNIPHNLNIKQVYGSSHPRNHRILGLFKKAGLIEKVGTGLKRMEELMLLHGLKKPVYSTIPVQFKVVFHGPADKILELVKPSNQLDLRDLGLNERQIAILNFLQKHKFITAKDYAKKFEVSGRSSRRDLEKLVQIKYLKIVGKSTAVKYFIQESLPSLSSSH